MQVVVSLLVEDAANGDGLDINAGWLCGCGGGLRWTPSILGWLMGFLKCDSFSTAYGGWGNRCLDMQVGGGGGNGCQLVVVYRWELQVSGGT